MNPERTRVRVIDRELPDFDVLAICEYMPFVLVCVFSAVYKGHQFQALLRLVLAYYQFWLRPTVKQFKRIKTISTEHFRKKLKQKSAFIL